jgi:hypothetical protein
MGDTKESMLRIVEERASEEARRLSAELIDGQPGDAEGIRAGIEFERWLASSCRYCRGEPRE